MQNIDKNNKIYYLILVINMILWSGIQLLRGVPSIDAMEALCWGELIDFGTNKHPPLSGWFMNAFYHLLGQHEIAFYILGQICIFVGLIYIYKLAKYFLSNEKALIASLITGLSFYFTYQTFIDNYNCNIILTTFSAITTYYFYKSLKNNNIKDWILLGLMAGLGFLAKYQIVFLFLPMLLYLLLCERKVFLKKEIYISIFIASIVVLPHILWLFNHDFFSFNYLVEKTSIHYNKLPSILKPISRIIFPIKFYLGQISSNILIFALFLIVFLREKNITFNTEGNKKDKIFLICVGLLPIIFLGLTGFINNSRVIGNWGTAIIIYIGLLLFYFFPINFKKSTYLYFIKWYCAIMIVCLFSIFIFAKLNNKLFINYPQQKIMNDFDRIWADETNNSNLKYVGGDIDYIFQFRIYNKQKPKIILDTFGYKNPWLDENDIINSGALIFTKDKEDIERVTRQLIYLLPKNYKIDSKLYVVEVKNILNKTKNYEFYYVIIPPISMYQK